MILCCPLPPFFLGWYSSERHGHAAMQVTVPFDQSFQSENYTRKITELRKLLALPHGSSFAGHQLSAMIRDLAIQQKDGFCDMPSLHQHITQTYLERLVNITLRNFSDTIPEPVEYDPDYPDFNVEISKKMKDFDTTHLLDAEVALPFAQKLRSQLEVLARERRRINDEFGNSIANWRDVLRRGCDLLASRKIGGRFVVERKQDLSPFLTSPEIIRLDPPVCLGFVTLDFLFVRDAPKKIQVQKCVWNCLPCEFP